MKERVISGPDCISEGADWLARREPRFATVLPLLAPLPLRLKPDGFAELLNAIVGQQVSTASAAAIWRRLTEAGMTTPQAVASATPVMLQGLGLSRPKVRYAQALARADLDYDALRQMPTDAVIAQLTAVPGIGPWTAEIYAMFSLGRADVFAAGDLALQEAARLIFELPSRPTASALRHMAGDWSPWRSVAARIMWAYYRHDKQREGIR